MEGREGRGAARDGSCSPAGAGLISGSDRPSNRAMGPCARACMLAGEDGVETGCAKRPRREEESPERAALQGGGQSAVLNKYSISHSRLQGNVQ